MASRPGGVNTSRIMGAPNGAPVAPPSTISSTALTYEESSDARKSTAGNLFRLAPTALRNRGSEELLQLSGIFCGSRGAGPAFPNGSFDRAWCDDVHANVARCKVGGGGTRHRDDPIGSARLSSRTFCIMMLYGIARFVGSWVSASGYRLRIKKVRKDRASVDFLDPRGAPIQRSYMKVPPQ